MAVFRPTILTDGGKQLLSQVISKGLPLNFTKIQIGDGVWDSTVVPEQLTALVSPKQTLPIQEIVQQPDGTIRIRFILRNVGITQGFFLRELGILAQDPSGTGEILYAITYADTPDYIPPENTISLEYVVDIYVVVSNYQNVTATISDTVVLATKNDITNQISVHNTDNSAHADIRQQINDLVAGNILAGNADKVDGYDASTEPAPNTIPVANTTGKLDPDWIPFRVVTPPKITTVQKAKIGTTITLEASASKTAFADNNATITYEWILPDGTTRTGSIINYTIPTTAQINSLLTFKCRAVDSLGNSSEYTTVNVMVANNTPPVIKGIKWSSNYHIERLSYTLTIDAVDYDGDNLTYSVTSNINGVTITQDANNPNVFTITYPSFQTDTFVIFTIKVSDSSGDFDQITEVKTVRARFTKSIKPVVNTWWRKVVEDVEGNLYVAGAEVDSTNTNLSRPVLIKMDKDLNVIAQYHYPTFKNQYYFAALYVDFDGFIYALTNSGELLKFDQNFNLIAGIKLEAYTNNYSHPVAYMVEDIYGNIIVITESGDQNYTRLSKNLEPIFSYNIPSVTAFAQNNQGELYIGNSEYIYKFMYTTDKFFAKTNASKRYRIYTSSTYYPNIRSLAISPDGEIFAFFKSGYNNNNFIGILYSDLDVNRVHNVVDTNESYPCPSLITPNRELVIGKGNVIYIFPIDQLKSSDPPITGISISIPFILNDIISDKDGNLIVVGDNGSILRISPDLPIGTTTCTAIGTTLDKGSINTGTISGSFQAYGNTTPSYSDSTEKGYSFITNYNIVKTGYAFSSCLLG